LQRNRELLLFVTTILRYSLQLTSAEITSIS
jgi:hypothetical protein